MGAFSVVSWDRRRDAFKQFLNNDCTEVDARNHMSTHVNKVIKKLVES